MQEHAAVSLLHLLHKPRQPLCFPTLTLLPDIFVHTRTALILHTAPFSLILLCMPAGMPTWVLAALGSAMHVRFESHGQAALENIDAPADVVHADNHDNHDNAHDHGADDHDGDQLKTPLLTSSSHDTQQPSDKHRQQQMNAHKQDQLPSQQPVQNTQVAAKQEHVKADSTEVDIQDVTATTKQKQPGGAQQEVASHEQHIRVQQDAEKGKGSDKSTAGPESTVAAAATDTTAAHAIDMDGGESMTAVSECTVASTTVEFAFSFEEKKLLGGLANDVHNFAACSALLGAAAGIAAAALLAEHKWLDALGELLEVIQWLGLAVIFGGAADNIRDLLILPLAGQELVSKFAEVLGGSKHGLSHMLHNAFELYAGIVIVTVAQRWILPLVIRLVSKS